MFFIGIIITLITEISLTGAVVGVRDANQFVGLTGFAVIFLGVILMITSENLEKRIKVTSHIRDQVLIRKSKETTENQKVEKEMNHLIKELIKDNLQAGIGKPEHIAGTDIYYMRGKRGARLFYRKTNYGYDIVGKAAKKNEYGVKDRIIQLYEEEKLFGQKHYEETKQRD